MYEIFAQLLAEKGLRAADVTRATGIKSPVFSEWKKGKSRPNADKMLLIANFLGVSVEYLMTGTEKQPAPELTARNEKDIEKALQGTLEQLDSQDGLMFDGAAMDPETRELLRLSLENTIRTAKITAKKKFTPKNIRANEDD